MTDATENDPPPVLTRRELEARIIAKAWRDPAYRKALLRTPKAVLRRELGAIAPSAALPPKLKVKVHEEAPNRYHLVLPRNPAANSAGSYLIQTVAADVSGSNPVTPAGVSAAGSGTARAARTAAPPGSKTGPGSKSAAKGEKK